MRLERAGHADAAWLAAVLDRTGRRVGGRVALKPGDVLTLRAG